MILIPLASPEQNEAELHFNCHENETLEPHVKQTICDKMFVLNKSEN